jgi:hypothetical protein
MQNESHLPFPRTIRSTNQRQKMAECNMVGGSQRHCLQRQPISAGANPRKYKSTTHTRNETLRSNCMSTSIRAAF